MRSHPPPRRARLPLIGRDDELQALRALIDGSAWPVTVTGPPGIGKSHLVATALAGSARAVAHIDLRDLLDEGKPTAPATFPRDPRPLLAGLDAELELLVLEHPEHAMDALRTALGALARRAPLLRVVLTSRVRTGLPFERCLFLDGVGARPTPRSAPRDDPAVALLLAAAAAEGVDEAVICRCAHREHQLVALVGHLGRNPLAILDAASRMRTASPCELVREITATGRLFAIDAPAAETARDDGHTHAGEDQSRLWRALDRAVFLLDPATRAALLQLAVLAQPFDARAAAAVVALPRSRPGALPELLDALLLASLLQIDVSRDSHRWFALDPSLRAFLLHHLEADPAALGAAADRHAAWVREAVDAPEPPAYVAAGALATLEHAVRPAICAPARLEDAAAAFLAARHLVQRRGHIDHAADRVGALLAHADALAPRTVVRLEAALGELLYACGRGHEAARRLETVLADPRHASDATGRALVASALGASWFFGHADIGTKALDDARAVLDSADHRAEGRDVLMRVAAALEHTGAVTQALETYQRVIDASDSDDPRPLAVAEINRASLLAHLQRYDEAIALTRRALARARLVGDRLLEAVALFNIGVCHFHRLGGGAASAYEARTNLEEAVDVAERAAVFRSAIVGHLHLGLMAHAAGDLVVARGHYERADALWTRRGPDPFGEALLGLAHLTLHTEEARPREARRWLDRITLALDGLDGPAATTLTALAAIALDAASTPAQRLTAATGAVEPALRLLRGVPRAGGHELRAALRLFGAKVAPAPPVDMATLVVALDGGHFVTPEGRYVSLGRRGPARRMLAGLAASTSAPVRTALSVEELFELGWPGSPLSEPYRSSRVYGIISELRSLGLGSTLAHTGDGYELQGSTVVLTRT